MSKFNLIKSVSFTIQSQPKLVYEILSDHYAITYLIRYNYNMYNIYNYNISPNVNDLSKIYFRR